MKDFGFIVVSNILLPNAYLDDPGEVFNKHYDGAFPRTSKDTSILTFILYLSDKFEQGHTIFYDGMRKEVTKTKPVRNGRKLIN